ncbi:ABC transporter permease [bacterium]|nr:ABC transporter permease [bacterium]
MIRNYLKIAIRNFLKYKTISVINLLGFSIGIAAFILVVRYAVYEWQYDRYHRHADRIFRLVSDIARSPVPSGPSMQAELPGIEKVVRLSQNADFFIGINPEKQFRERFYLADSAFFEIFSFHFIHGSATSALKTPESVVLTASTALRYFGTIDAMGKNIPITYSNREYLLNVTGVIDDPPVQSHFIFDLIGSFKLYENHSNDLQVYDNNLIYTYFLLESSKSSAHINDQIEAFYARHGVQPEEFRKKPFLQSLLDIHLSSGGLRFEISPQGDKMYVLMFVSIAILVLVIACINFVNLSTARSSKRAVEVGMRKVFGAERRQLIRQFMSEAALTSSTAVLIALGLTELSLPMFESLVERNLSLDLSSGLWMFPALVLFIAVMTFASGSYPAAILSSYTPLHAFKAKSFNRPSHRGFRYTLVTFQIASSVFLIIAMLAITKQMDFMKTIRLGFDREQVVVINYGPQLWQKVNLLQTELTNSPYVTHVSAALTLPGDANTYGVPFAFEGMSDVNIDNLLSMSTDIVDFDFVESLGMEMAFGRTPDRKRVTDSTGYLINETAWKELIEKVGGAWKDPIGKRIDYFTSGNGGWQLARSGYVLGVVRDFHFRSLHHQIGPMVLQMHPPTLRNLIVRLRPGNTIEAMTFIEKKWTEITGRPFAYRFLDESIDRQYQMENKAGTMVKYLTILALIISALGLFGLIVFTVEQRTKEISIRKVLGASVPIVALLITKEFITFVVIANLIVWPLGWWAIHQWLADFAYQAHMGFEILATAGLVTLLLVVITVAYHTIKTSLTNPAEALRHE